MKEVFLFFLTFMFVLIIYELFVVRKAKRKKKKDRKEPIEISYLVRRYNFNIKKINYSRLLQVVAIVSSFDIALIVSIVMNIHNFLLEIVVGFLSLFIIIFISYHIVYLFYKKKGLI